MTTPPDQLRRKLRDHYRKCSAIAARHSAAVQAYIASEGRSPVPRQPVYPPFPEECRGMQCGAKTRSGGACKRTALYANGRCKHHGGESTGPKSDVGRERARANLALRWPPRVPDGA